MQSKIDLNADLGESDEAADITRDIAMMRFVSSVNIACGGHAGSDTTMHAMTQAAAAKAVRVGAHPSYPDRANFGRISMEISRDELATSLERQVLALADVAEQHGLAIAHVKPHGALYNDAANDTDLALLIADVTARSAPGAALMGLSGGAMEQAAKDFGLYFIAEAFLDRRYTRSGRLVPRNAAGAIIASEEERVAQALALAKGKPIITADNSAITIAGGSLCMHSDSAGALESADTIRRALEDAGIEIGQPA